MQKIIFIIFILLSTTTIINAQLPTINSDSLLAKFNMLDAFSVLEKTNMSKVDITDCYHNENLKPYLLIWLDKEAYFDHLNQRYIQNAFTDDYKVYKVKGWLTKYKRKDLIDTVMQNPALFDIYLDSVIVKETKRYRRDFFQDGGSLPSNALDFHARLKLPEAYEILHKYWKEDGGKIESGYFYVMLAMHDPEAIEMNNIFVDNAIKNKDIEALNDIRRKANNEYLLGSYAIELKLKLLLITEKIKHSFSSFPEGAFDSPYNIDFLNPLSDRCFQYSSNDTVLKILNHLYNPIDKIYTLSYEELEKYSKEIKQNIDVFKKAVEPYKYSLIKEELYWKKNMPFYEEDNTN